LSRHLMRQASLPFVDMDVPTAPTGDWPRLTEWAPEQWPVSDDWHPVLDRFLSSASGQQLGHFIQQRLAGGAVIYPPQPFHALALTALTQVKVLILGQDPYHGPGQAQGLAFSVPTGTPLPPSLRNIFKEIANDPLLERQGLAAPGDGCLERWARQGVLLLNTCLTVEQGQAASHAQRGWEMLTDDIVKMVALKKNPVVFMLWGAQAQAKRGLISATNAAQPDHLVLSANHPSPLSARRPPRPFLGCGHFGQANAFLQRQGSSPIAW